MNVKSTFAKNLEFFLLENGCKRSDLYKAVGVDKSTASRWFNNGTMPESKTLQKIAKFLDVPSSLLMDERNPEEKYLESFTLCLSSLEYTQDELNSFRDLAKAIKKKESPKECIEQLTNIANII